MELLSRLAPYSPRIIFTLLLLTVLVLVNGYLFLYKQPQREQQWLTQQQDIHHQTRLAAHTLAPLVRQQAWSRVEHLLEKLTRPAHFRWAALVNGQQILASASYPFWPSRLPTQAVAVPFAPTDAVRPSYLFSIPLLADPDFTWLFAPFHASNRVRAASATHRLTLILKPAPAAAVTAAYRATLHEAWLFNGLLLGGTLFYLLGYYRLISRRLQPLYRLSHTLLRDDRTYLPELPAGRDLIARLGENLRQLVAYQQSGHTRLQEAQAYNQALLNLTGDAILSLDADGRIQSLNPAAERLFGYTAFELQGRVITDILLIPTASDLPRLYQQQQDQRHRHADGQKIQLECKDGSRLTLCLSLNRLGESQNYSFIALLRDLTPQQQAQAYVDFLAYYDALTGISNRTLFMDRLQHAMQLCRRQRKQLALLYIDLDHFHLINESLGYDVGDQLLQQVAARISRQTRVEDSLARLGNDAFGLLLENLKDSAHGRVSAERLREALAEPFRCKEQDLFLTASIGISTHPHHNLDAEGLLQAAELANHRAKQAGRNTVYLYTPRLEIRARHRLSLEQHMQRALKHGEFLLLYQPQLDLHSEAFVGVEAQLRWQPPQLGLLQPDDFLPLLSNMGRLQELTPWLLQTACRHTSHWYHAGFPLQLTINLQLLDRQPEELAHQLRTVLQDNDLPPNTLNLELDSALLASLDRAQTRALLEPLAALGIGLVLDNASAGPLTLYQLKEYPLQALKLRLPREQTPADKNANGELIGLQRSLAQQQGLQMVVTGVESATQLAQSRRSCFDRAQGNHICRPLPQDHLETLLHNRPATIRYNPTADG